MGDPATTQERSWEQGWEGHDRAQRLRLSFLPLTDKLEWLEQAHRVVRHMQSRAAAEAARSRRVDPKSVGARPGR